MLERALALDPLSAPVRNALGVAVEAAGDSEGAVRIYREGLALDPEFEAYYDNLSLACLNLGRFEEMLEADERVSQLHPVERPPEKVRSLRRAYESDGAAGYWRASLEWALAHEDEWQRDISVGIALMKLGRHDEALDAFERAVASKSPIAFQFLYGPVYRPLAGHPRFEALKRQLRAG
jgi:tetratricopeptide (TPR) repeat protein